MDAVTLVGIDLGKHSFHLHGQDAKGKAVLRKKLSRKQLIEFFATFHACTVVMEACAGSHHKARKLAGLGHTVRLISPQFVRPFVKSNKNDFVDAEAICEAASRPTMRFVTPKTESQQTLSVLHRVRESMVRERTRTVNQMHGFLLEFGISLPVGKTAITRLPVVLAMQELMDQLRTSGQRVDHSVFAASSGGTQAGLTLGARLAGRARRSGPGSDEPPRAWLEAKARS